MAVVHDDVLGALPPAPVPRRRNVVMTGTLLAVAAGVALIGGLLAVYLEARAGVQAEGNRWVPDGTELPNVPLLVTYVTLLMSSVTAQWAVAAARMGDRRQVYLAIGTTLVLGIAFLNGMSFVWGQLGLVAGETRFATMVYAVTVTHVLLVVGAMVYVVVMGFRALGGQIGSRDHEFVAASVAFWHFTVAAGLAVWYTLWFLEGGP